MNLGNKILELRKKNGLSQEQLGEKVEVTRQTISNWELESTTPNPEQLKLLSKTLNVSIDELLDNNLKKTLENKVNKIDNNVIKNNNLLKTLFVVLLFVITISMAFVLSKFIF